MLRCFWLLCLGVFLVSGGGSGGWSEASAQAAGDVLRQIERTQNQIQMDQDQRLRELERRQRERILAPPQSESAPAAPEGDGSAPPQCFPVNRIELEGTEATSRSDVSAILDEFSGRCLGVGDIDRLLRSLTNRYVDLGYTTTRVYVPQQDLKSRTLNLLIHEGRISGLRLNGREDDAQLMTAFPGLNGEILNLRDLEQGLDQMNRLRSNNAKLELIPGDKPGETAVDITNTAATPWFVGAGTNNSGTPSTGERQGYAQLEANNLLNINDSWLINGQHSLASDQDIRRSRSLTAIVSLPYGYWTASLTGSWFDYRSPIYGLNRRFASTGHNYQWKGRLDRVLYRDDISKTLASMTFGSKDTVNYVEGEKVDANSRLLTVASLDLTHSRRILGGALSLTGSREVGLHLLGAKSDVGRSPSAPEAQFEKWVGDISFWRPLPFFDDSFSLSLALAARGQWSDDTLFPSERMALGGQYSVRGFKDESISGDIGGYVRNDVRLTLPQSGLDSLDSVAGRPYLNVGYDIGAIRRDSTDFFERGVLSGVSAGVGLSGGILNVAVTWSRSLRRPSFAKNEGNVVYFTAGLDF